MTQAEQDALKDVNDIQQYFLGSLLSGGNSDPKAGNSLAAWTDMCDGYQEHALKTRLRIPLLYGARMPCTVITTSLARASACQGKIAQIPNPGTVRCDP